MIKRAFKKIKYDVVDRFQNDRDFTLFLCVGIFVGVAAGINNSIFSNFLNFTYHLTEQQRGFVEFPRELPGASIMIVIGVIAFLGDIRIAAIGMVLAALGMVGLGVASPSFTVMILWLMVYSLGTHMVMPLTASIGMSLSKQESLGARLGLYSAFTLFATIFGYGVVWFGFNFLKMDYTGAFIIAAVFYVLACIVIFMMKNNRPLEKKPRFVFKKRYTLFYILSLINGGRKQIFLTFAPWVLITIFHLDAPTFALLGIIIAVISIATRTAVGRAIDKLGERFVLSCEAVLLIVICLGYAFAQQFLPQIVAVVVIAACYVLDSSMSVVEMARSTYVKKIAESDDDVTPTLSAGISLDHIVAMTIPTLGGILWAATGGYQSVFVAAAVIATANLILSLKMKIV